MAKSSQHKRCPSAREFGASDAYNRLIYIIQNSETMADAARRLGRSTRTLRRWKSEGIPDRSLFKDNNQLSNKISRVSGAFKAAATRQEKPQQKPTQKPPKKKELRYTFYERNYGGSIVRHYPVEFLPYEALLEILMMECLRQPKTVAYTFLLEFNAPFSGMWDGETLTSDEQLSLMMKSEVKNIRNNGSWIDVSMSDPFTSTKLIDFKNTCTYDQISDVLNKYFFSQHTKIYEIRVKQRRSWTDEQDEADYDY